MIQAHIYYIGTVQGVGFRYTAQRYAEIYKLTGWVKNLSDGRVEMTVCGLKASIEEFCSKLDAHFDGFISNRTVEYSENNPSFEKFQIIG